MKPPKTQIQSVLYRLINSVKGLAERDTNYNMFRGYISILRRDLLIKHTDVPHVNIFGRKGYYRRHWLTESEKRKARKLYKKMYDKKD
jgi:hypothetical protein